MKTKLYEEKIAPLNAAKRVLLGNLRDELPLGNELWEFLSDLLPDFNLEYAFYLDLPLTERGLEAKMNGLRTLSNFSIAVIYYGGHDPRGIIIPPEGIPLVGPRTQGQPSSLYPLRLPGAFVAENGGKLFDSASVDAAVNLARNLNATTIAIFRRKNH